MLFMNVNFYLMTSVWMSTPVGCHDTATRKILIRVQYFQLAHMHERHKFHVSALGMVQHIDVINYMNTSIYVMSVDKEDVSSTTCSSTWSGVILRWLDSNWIWWCSKTLQVGVAVWECHLVYVSEVLGTPADQFAISQSCYVVMLLACWFY